MFICEDWQMKVWDTAKGLNISSGTAQAITSDTLGYHKVSLRDLQMECSLEHLMLYQHDGYEFTHHIMGKVITKKKKVMTLPHLTTLVNRHLQEQLLQEMPIKKITQILPNATPSQCGKGSLMSWKFMTWD